MEGIVRVVRKIGLSFLHLTTLMVVGGKIEKQGLRNKSQGLWSRTTTPMSLGSCVITATQLLVGMELAPTTSNMWKRTA